MSDKDVVAALSGWLEAQAGPSAEIAHDGAVDMPGGHDVAEAFTITLPSAQLDRLYHLASARGCVSADMPEALERLAFVDLRIDAVRPMDVLTCKAGFARQQFTLVARWVQW